MVSLSDEFHWNILRENRVRFILHLRKFYSLGYLEIVRILVEKGADVNIKDDYERTALKLSIEFGNLTHFMHAINWRFVLFDWHIIFQITQKSLNIFVSMEDKNKKLRKWAEKLSNIT